MKGCVAPMEVGYNPQKRTDDEKAHDPQELQSSPSVNLALRFPNPLHRPPLPTILRQRQKLEESHPPAPPAPPADAQLRADAWRTLQIAVFNHMRADNYIPEQTTYLPTETRPEFIDDISSAYQAGWLSFATSDPSLKPSAPANAGTTMCLAVLWDYYWQGHNYAERQHVAAQSKSKNPRAPKVSDPEPYHADRDKYTDFVAQLHLVIPQVLRP